MFDFWATGAVEGNSEIEGDTFLKSINLLFCRHGRITKLAATILWGFISHSYCLWGFLLDSLLF